MSDLKHRQRKIQEKRKQTSFRDFVKEIASRIPLVFYKHDMGVSRYPPVNRLQYLVSPLEFEELRLQFTEQGLDYDSEKSFFQQFSSLYASLPQPIRLLDPLAENVDYAEAVWKANNVYLSFIVIDDCENIGYSFYIQDVVKNTWSSMMVWNQCDTIFQSVAVLKSYKIFYARYITNCANIRFSTNLIGCQECLFCDHLSNQSYCIYNKLYEKEAYFREKERLLADKSSYEKRYSALEYTSDNYNSENIEGIFCIHSHDIENGRYVYRVEHGRNIMFAGHEKGRKNMYDCFGSDQIGEGNMYACSNMGSSDHAYCCDCCQMNTGFYSFFCIQCSYCFGCIGLVNKSYCILNKQYTKKERHQKVDEICSAMEKEGTLGDFFPASMNPFYFNDTAAYLIDDSFTKEEVEAEGYLWRDEEVKVDIPEGMEVVKVSELGEYEGRSQTPPPNFVGDLPLSGETNVGAPLIRGGGLSEAKDGGVGKTRYINPTILDKVIQDEQGNVYRIVKMEYDFLMKHGLPLPRLHRLDRLKQNFKIK